MYSCPGQVMNNEHSHTVDLPGFGDSYSRANHYTVDHATERYTSHYLIRNLTAGRYGKLFANIIYCDLQTCALNPVSTPINIERIGIKCTPVSCSRIHINTYGRACTEIRSAVTELRGNINTRAHKL